MSEIYNSTYNTTTGTSLSTGSYHLSDNKHLYEVQRTNNFEFIVALGLEGSMKRAGANTEDTALKITNQQATDVLRLSVASAPIPHFKQTPLSIRRGNSVMKFAGTPDFESGTIRFHDFIGADTKSILMAWQNLSYNVRTQNVGLMSDYKRDATLLEYSPDYHLVRSWTLKGCWISGLKEDDYNQEEGKGHMIEATIEYDYAYPNEEGQE